MRSVLLVVFCLVFVSQAANVYRAVTTLSSALPAIEPSVTGTLTFDFEPSTNTTTVTVKISGIQTNPDGLHGIHLHAFGDLRGLISGAGANVVGGSSAGGHFNPYNSPHGCPENVTSAWHVGDMGNWQATGGVIDETKTLNQVSLLKGAVNSIIGRAVVLHETVDDCINTTSAGRRLAYGVIGIANVALPDINKAGGSDVSEAVCVIQGTVNCSGTCALGQTGLVHLINSGNSVKITAQVHGLSSQRGFHIHEFGDLTVANGNSAGGHYNPQALVHGLPPSQTRHLGDLGTINAFLMYDAYYQYTPTLASYPWSITDVLGRAMVIHQWVDHGTDPTCQQVTGYATGAAGARHYWCVIGVLSTADQTVPANLLATADIPTPLTNSVPASWENIPCSTVAPGSTTGSTASSLNSYVVLLVLVVVLVVDWLL